MADEAFLCGSSMELTPVVSIDGNKLGEGRITRKIHRAYLDAVIGAGGKFKDWATPIY